MEYPTYDGLQVDCYSDNTDARVSVPNHSCRSIWRRKQLNGWCIWWFSKSR